MFLTDELTGHVNASHGGGSARHSFLQDVLTGLSAYPKTLPCKYFYDERGSQIFDAICELQEYYPTRTELGIMEDQSAAMAAIFQTGDVLVELGSGSSLKTRLLLDQLPMLSSYVPVDISADYLASTAEKLRLMYPQLCVRPVAADYTKPFAVPLGQGTRVIVYFPGSTIGNFHPVDAAQFLAQIRAICRGGGRLLIGVDLRKDIDVLEAAYNDKCGVTADFNLNLLRRINQELGGTFDLESFAHQAIYNVEKGRIEMHLRSLCVQSVGINGRKIAFEKGETIWTESSYKYSLGGFARLAEGAGFDVETVWTDPNKWFSVQDLRAV